MGTLQDLFISFDRMGVLDVLIPFLLIFVLIFAVLQKTKVLGTRGSDRKPVTGINRLVALIMGLAVVIPHVTGTYPPGKDVVVMMNTALPQVSIVVVAVVMLLILIGVWGNEIEIAGTPLASIAVWLSLIVVVVVFGSAAGWFGGGSLPSWLWWLKDSDTQAAIVIILVFAVLIWFITREDSGSNTGESSTKKLLEGLGSMGKVIKK